MPNLESLIAKWRASLPFEAAAELEDHLRDTIERLKQTGLNETDAFHAATKQLGSPDQLVTEFEKIDAGQWWPVKLALGLASLVSAFMAVFVAVKMIGRPDGPLLGAHVFAITLGYGGVFLTGALGFCYVLQRSFAEFNSLRLRSIAKVTVKFATASTIFTALGTVLGMLWAKQAWDRYWAWDPKETGAFYILLWLAAYQIGARFTTPRTTMLLAIFGNFIVTYGWFGPSGSNSFLIFTSLIVIHLTALAVGFLPAGTFTPTRGASVR